MFLNDEERARRAMFLSDDEVQERVSASAHVVTRTKGPSPSVPEVVRILAGAACRVDGPLRAKAEFGPTNPAAYANHPKSQAIVERAEAVAAERMLEALGLLTTDKMAQCQARDIADIAVSMSKICKKEAGPTVGNQILIYAPRTRDDDDFEVIQT